MIICWPSTARAAGECTKLKNFRTQININLEISEPFYDTGISVGRMTAENRAGTVKWLKKNNMQSLWSADDMTTNGLAISGFNAATRERFIAEPFEKHFGVHYCPYFQSVDIDLFYRTLIEIPHDYVNRPCEFDLVRTHELKHDKVYREAIQIYADCLRNDMQPIIQDLEADYELRTDINKREGRMSAEIEDALKVYFEDAAGARMEQLNALVDSPQEYATGSALMRACAMKEH